MIADMQDFTRGHWPSLSARSRFAVRLSNHRIMNSDAIRICNALNLRHHPGRLDGKDEPCLLAFLPVDRSR